MLALLLLLALIWVVLVLVGVVVKGLFWLFLIGCVLLVLTLIVTGFCRRRSSNRTGR